MQPAIANRLCTPVLRHCDLHVPVSSEIPDFTPCAHAQSNILHIKYAAKTEVWVCCLSKCVRLGFMLGLEKESNLGLELSPRFFSGCSYSRTVAFCGYLTSNQKF